LSLFSERQKNDSNSMTCPSQPRRCIEHGHGFAQGGGVAGRGLNPLLAGQEFDVAVTMGCSDECPFIRAKDLQDWQILDPKGLLPQ
jgi:hypothetical protein